MPVYITMAEIPAIKWSVFAHETHSHRRHIYHRIKCQSNSHCLISFTPLWLWCDTAAKSIAHLTMLLKAMHTDRRCDQLNTQQVPYKARKVNNTTYSPIFPFPKQPTISHTLIRTMIHPVAGFHTPFIASTRDEVICLCETKDPAVL